VATIIYYAPQAIRVRISFFALPGEVSLDQADYILLKESAYSTRAGSATPALLLTKLMSLVVTSFASGLYLLFLVFPVRYVEIMSVLKA
jgi:hypothetical protein